MIALKSLILSFLAIPACFFFQWMDWKANTLFLMAILLLLGYIVLSYLICARELPSGVKKDPYVYLFMLFAFTSVIDGLLALTVSGYSNVLEFYLDHGERYMNTPHGLSMNIWDATAHLAMYIVMIHHLATQSRSKYAAAVALSWVGSIVNSLVVIIIAVPSGEHSLEIQPSILLNVPFILVPVMFASRFITDRNREQIDKDKVKKTDVSGAVKMIGLICGLPLLVISIARAYSVIGSPLMKGWVEPYLSDPSFYPKVQALLIAFTYLPALPFISKSGALACILGGALMQAGATTGIASVWIGGGLFAGIVNGVVCLSGLGVVVFGMNTV